MVGRERIRVRLNLGRVRLAPRMQLDRARQDPGRASSPGAVDRVFERPPALSRSEFEPAEDLGRPLRAYHGSRRAGALGHEDLGVLREGHEPRHTGPMATHEGNKFFDGDIAAPVRVDRLPEAPDAVRRDRGRLHA